MSKIDFEYTTAERLAATFTTNDRGKLIADLSTDDIWMVTKGGAGLACMSRVATSGTDMQFSLPISLRAWSIVSSAGDVGDIVANGGELASDSDPILRGDAAESWEIFWAANSVVAVGCELELPRGFDGSQDVFLDLDVYSGTTDAATIGVESSWDGGANVADSAVDTSTKSATRHTITATIAAADVPNSARQVTLQLTPPAHATNGIAIVGARLRGYIL